MNSSILKSQKNQFTGSVLKYIEQYEEIAKKLKQIDIIVDNSDDNLLYSHIKEANEEIDKKIREMKEALERYQNNVVRIVDIKIAELEAMELKEKEKLAEEENIDTLDIAN